MVDTKKSFPIKSRNCDLIYKVLSTLEFLKVCTSHDEPTGEGIPVNIAVMPDFVVDVDGAAINQLNTSKGKTPGRIAAAEIGSRAGRVLSILAHLRDTDDISYQLHYVTKTGLTGRAVLEERLQQYLSRRKLQPVQFPYLVPAEHTRFVVLGRGAYKKIPEEHRQIVKPTCASILRLSELENHFYNPLRVISDINSLYFAADSIIQFDELIDTAVNANSSEMGSCNSGITLRYVFVDLAAIHLTESYEGVSEEADIPGFKALKESIIKLRSLKHTTYCTMLTVFTKVPVDTDNIENHLKRVFSKKGLHLCTGKDVVVVCHSPKAECDSENTNHRVCFQWYDGKDFGKIETIVDPNRPDAREAIVAGMLLYRAVGSAWSAVRQETHYRSRISTSREELTDNLFPDPYDLNKYTQSTKKGMVKRVNENWTFAEAVEFGMALSQLWHDKPMRESTDRRALLLANLPKEEKDIALSTRLETLDRSELNIWCKTAMLLEAYLVPEENKSRIQQEFIKKLWDVVKKNDLTMAPKNWKSCSTRALKTRTRETIKSMISLKILQRFAAKKPGGLKCLNIDAAYMTDLDGTLLKSSELRFLCYKNAFVALLNPRSQNMVSEGFPVFPTLRKLTDALEYKGFSDAIKSTIGTILNVCVKLYETSVYKQAKYWEAILKNYPYYHYGKYPRDFKQVWNHQLSYPIFLWTISRLFEIDSKFKSNHPTGVIFDAFGDNKIKEFVKQPRDKQVEEITKKLIDWFDIADENGELVVNKTLDSDYKEIVNIEIKHKPYFDEAIKRFWNVDYEPFRQTGEALRTLRDVLGSRLYVATEGHHETQVNKIKVMGLGRFFPEMTILSTEAAASTHEDLRNIQDELRIKNELLEHYQFTLKQYGTNNPGLAKNVEDDIEIAKKEKDYLDRYKGQWHPLQRKDRAVIYPLIVASILIEPDFPFEGLTDLRLLVHKLSYNADKVKKTYFAMVGDRESKDIIPIIDSCNANVAPQNPNASKHVATVRFLSPDHKDEDIYWDNITAKKVKAKYVVWSPIQVVLCLARESAWNSPLDYHTIPAILPGRLATKEGKIDNDMLTALVWGRGIGKESIKNSIDLINSLLKQGTIRDGKINNKGLIEGLKDALDTYRKQEGVTKYTFLLEIAEEMLEEMNYIPKYELKEIAEALRDVVCYELSCPSMEVETYSKLTNILINLKNYLKVRKLHIDPLTKFLRDEIGQNSDISISDHKRIGKVMRSV